MPFSPEAVKNALSVMSNSGRKLDQVVEKGGDGEYDKSDRLPIVFVSKPCKFQARIVADKNGVLGRSYMSYNIPIPNDEGIESRVRYTVEGVQKTKTVADGTKVTYTDYRTKDPVLEYALALEKQTQSYKFKPRFAVAYYADITSIKTGESQYFKKGPCVLIFNGDTFMKNFASVSENLLETKDAQGKEIGLAMYASTIDPSCKGLTMSIEYVPGRQGVKAECVISFATLSGLTHEFPPEVVAKFTDITKEYAPVPGSDNDANGLKLIEFYKRRLSQVSNYARPDDVDDAPVSGGDIGDELTVALDGLGLS
jgi:hypothetical protein